MHPPQRANKDNMDIIKEKEYVDKIKEYIFETYSLSEIDDKELKEEISVYTKVCRKTKMLSPEDQKTVSDRVFSIIRGFDILDELLADDSITEIMVNSYNKIFIEKNGVMGKSEYRFESRRRFEDVIERIAGISGKEVNYAVPIADAVLPGSERVNIVLPPAAVDGPNITIRKFSKDPLTMEDLIENNTLTRKAAEFLIKLVKAKYNIFISGGTSSGKTTFLNVLTDYIPPDERIITIEDVTELHVRNTENVIRLQSRRNNSAGAGEITIRDLIKTALRMRPERIIVGEVRAEEAIDMLQAMNTGHDGSLSTGHANSSQDMLLRLETMVLSGESGLPLYAVRQQIACAIDIIIHLAKDKNGNRKVVEISEMKGLYDNMPVLNQLYSFDNEKGLLQRTKNKMTKTAKAESYGEK